MNEAGCPKSDKAENARGPALTYEPQQKIAARIADELFDELDAPVKRVAAMDTFVAYQPALENVILPQSSDLFAAMQEMAEY